MISRHGGLFTRLDVTIRGVAWPRMFTPLERRVALAENPPCCLHKEFLLQAVQQLQQYPVQETVVVVVVFFVFFCTSGGQLVLCHSRKYLCARFLSLSARLSRERWRAQRPSMSSIMRSEILALTATMSGRSSASGLRHLTGCGGGRSERSRDDLSFYNNVNTP